MTDSMLLVLAAIVAVAAVLSIRRGWDVRLVLFCAGLLLCTAAGAWNRVFDTFQGTLGKADIIGPICSAMGYAWVLKATECDKHMVRFLLRPIQRIGWMLIPGGIAIGFITNMAITSQTATAAAVGPVLIPILIAAGFRPLLAGAVLIVGCSIGGNLFNPGEPDIVAIHAATSVKISSIINSALLPNLISLAAASLVLVGISLRMPRTTSAVVPTENPEPLSVTKAIMPPLPVLLLLLLQPGLGLVPPLLALYPTGVHVSMVMLVCTSIVAVVSWKHPIRGFVGRITTEFFEGMGFAFSRVISLIVAAACFIAGLDAAGAIKGIAAMFASRQDLASVLSPIVTWGLAVVSGSGTAPSVSFTQALVPAIAAVDVMHGVDIGILGAVGASLGRTMSPVAAIVLFTSTLVDIKPSELVGLTKWPILASLVVVVAFGLFS